LDAAKRIVLVRGFCRSRVPGHEGRVAVCSKHIALRDRTLKLL
jgi:hypothetical protein